MLGRLAKNMLVQVFLLAVLFRAALYLSGLVDVVLFTNDSYQYDELAKSMLHGQFAEGGHPSMNRTPGYPAMLAFVYLILGTSGLAITAVQIAIDALTCVMAVHLGMALGLKRPGLWATAVLCVTCLHTSAFSFQIMTETLYTFLLLGAIWLLKDPPPTPLRAALSGLAFGVNVLVRPAIAMGALLFIGGLFVLDIVQARKLTLRVLRIPALMGSLIAVLVVPWMARNYLTFPEIYSDPDREDASLLGFKGSYPSYTTVYSSRGFAKHLLSYEEPYYQTKPWEPPVSARYVYPGEAEEVRAAYAVMAKDIQEIGRYRRTSIPAFEAITEKRYAAAPRLYLTSPLSHMIKVWFAPRASVLWANASGYSMGLAANAALTVYGALYVILGVIGLWISRRSSPLLAIYVAAMLAYHTYIYAIWAPFVQSRYAIPMFPLFATGAGVCLDRALVWRRARERSSVTAAPQASTAD